MDLKWQKTWCWSLAGWIIYPSSQTPGVRVLALGVQEISVTCPMFSMNYVMNLGQMKWTICWSPVFSFPMIILHLMPPCTIRKGEVSKAWGDAMTHSFFSCYCNTIAWGMGFYVSNLNLQIYKAVVSLNPRS